MVRLLRSRVMPIPRAYLGSPRSEISHLEVNSALKRSISLGDDAVARMSSTCTTKIMVPVADCRLYTHHSHASCSKPQPTMAALNVLFQIRLACFMPYMLFISFITQSSFPASSNPSGCSTYLVS